MSCGYSLESHTQWGMKILMSIQQDMFRAKNNKNVFSLSGPRNMPTACAQISLSINKVWTGPLLLFDIIYIMKTCLYNFDPLKPHWGLQGYTLFFLFLLKNVDCGYLLQPPCRGSSNQYTQFMFWAEIRKISEFFYLKIFSFWRWNFLYIWIGMFS